MARKRTEPNGKRWRKVRASQEAGLKKMVADPARYKKKLRGGKQGKILEHIEAAGLLGTGLSRKSVAARTGLKYFAVCEIEKQMQDQTLRGEAFRKAAQEARERIQGKALDALEAAIRLAVTQIKKGVKNSGGKFVQAPLSHVAQAVQSLGKVALHEGRPGEEPRRPDPANTVPLTAKQIGELLMQVRDHEQAKSSREVDVTPTPKRLAP